MLRRIPGLARVASLGVVSLVLYAPAVQADPPGSTPAASATTLPATDVTVTSALLNASLETRGQPTQWEFQYGATTDHDHSTPLSQVPAGGGTIRVSAKLNGLSAMTTYHFRVIAISGIGSHYTEVYYAADLSFTTKAWNGALLLVGRRLHVSAPVVDARLMCSSTRACAGRFSIGTRAQGTPGGEVVCATKSFRIGARMRAKVGATLSQTCLSLLMKSPDHRLKGRFSSATSTRQRGQNASVELVLG